MKIDENLYEVEEILDRRKVGHRIEYLVKWLDFGSEHNSWEKAKNMCCPSMIEEFEFIHSSREFDQENPFNRGYEIEEIVDVELGSPIWFLVKFMGKSRYEWVENSVMKKECPQFLIDFYESKIYWID